MNNKVFIAVAWPYVNGEIHVGHLAGYLIPCDIFARYSRLCGKEVLMVSGTDCYGTPITVEADKRGISPQELVNEYDPKVRELIALYETSYDLFTSTVTENHKEVAQEIFMNLLHNGFIIKKRSEQYYSEKDNRFLPDRYVEGECPYCHSKDQRADQCENCGRTIGFGELIDPKSKLSGSEVTLKETEHYFIDFPKLQGEIKEFVEKSEHWREWVKNETLGWLKEGLEPRAITRDIDWGVAIPNDRIPKDLQLENAENKRFYVWYEAVIGYLSASREWSEKRQRDTSLLASESTWEDFWLNPDCKHYYFMGKDNLTFHTIFWPGQLIGQKKGYNLPYLPAVNQFLNIENKKFSKSRGVHIDAREVGEYFGVDIVRFYITSILPETKDSNWKWSEFKETTNKELVGNFGNFVHRTLTFFKNKLESTISEENTILDEQVEKEIKAAYAEIQENFEKCNFVAALNRILKLSQFGNQYFDSKKPWVSIKEQKADAEKTMYNCLQIVYTLTMMFRPIIPASMGKLDQMLGIGELNPEINVNKYNFDKLDMNKIHLAETIEPLFKKIEDEELEKFLGK